MGDTILSKKPSEYQLMFSSLKLVYKILNLRDTVPELHINRHFQDIYWIANDLSKEFEDFINFTKEGK